MRLIDTWANVNGWRSHSLEVIYLSLGLLLLAVALPPMPGAIMILVTAMLCALFGARIPPLIYFRVLLLPFSFLVFGSLALVFTVTFNSPLDIDISFSEQGLQTAKIVILRSMASVSSLILLTLCVPLAEMVAVMRKTRVPLTLIELIELMYRFLFICDEIFASLLKAQSVRLGYRNFRLSNRSLSMALAALLLRVMERAKRLERGLESRGYTGELKVMTIPRKISPRFLMFTITIHVFILAVTATTVIWSLV